MKGIFIVIDGPDRCGKDTIIEFLKEQFPDAVYAREPGGTIVAENLRNMLKNSDTELSAFTQFCLFWAARRDLLDKVIRPALDEGKLCILPRSDTSTLAYQVEGEQQQSLWSLFWSMREECFEEYKPGCYILLDIPAEASRVRRASTGDEKDYFEQQNVDYHERVRLGFLKFHHVHHTPTEVVDATQPPEIVRQEVLEIIESVLQERKTGAY